MRRTIVANNTISITGPDNNEYDFPDGTTKESAIAYFKAKGIGVSKPVDATASVARPPMPAAPVPDELKPDNFTGRVGERIWQNVNAVPDALQAINVGMKGKGPTPQQQSQVDYYQHLVGADEPSIPKKIAKIAFIAPRMVYDLGKSWTQDPANAVGDIIAGYVGHQMSSGGQPEEAVPAKMQSKVPFTEEQQTAYTKSLDKANAAHTEALAEYAEKESDARAKWVQKTYKAKQSAVDSVKAVNKKEILNRGVEEYTKVAQDNLQKTHDAVRGSLDARANTLRDGMEGATIPGDQTFNLVEQAKTKFLRGSPASLQQFNNLVKEVGIQNFIEDEAGNLTATPDNAPVPWDTARVHSSAIGNKLAAGGLEGNVYQALKYVKEGLDGPSSLAESKNAPPGLLEKAAEVRGRGDEYRSFKKDWSGYMTDWKDVSGVNKGGSPLAHAIASPDAPTVTKIINGPAGDRMIGTLAKYKRFGGRPDLLAATRSTSAAADAVKVPTTKATPAPYDAATPPELKSVPPPEAIPKKLGPIAKGALHLAGGIAGAKVMAPTGHTFVGYMAGSKVATALGESMLEDTSAVPPAFKRPGAVSRGVASVRSGLSKATPAIVPSAAVVGARALRGDSPDEKAIQDTHENIQDFIDSLPQ